MLAFVAALTWSLLPVLCPNTEAAEPRHSHAASAEADGSEAHAYQHPADHDSNQCCTELAAAKFVAPVAASAPAPKVVLVSAGVGIIAKRSIDNGQVADVLLARDATGPPKRSPPKFTNYRPLAPPAFG